MFVPDVCPIAGLTCLTADVPGVGGVIKARPEDFIVEELPLYTPCGEGEHLYLMIEKRRRTTSDVVHRLARLFNVRRGDIGYAGLKDKHAVSRQQFSVHLPAAGRETQGLERIGFTGLQLLAHARHTNKLRRGHLAGNRFHIRLRQVDVEAAAQRAQSVLEVLAQRGVPNFVGEQRFGYRGNNHLLGRCLLRGDWQEFLDELLGRPRPQDSPFVAAARAAYEQGRYDAALAHWPHRLHFDRRVLDLLRQGKDARAAVLGMDAGQREFLLSALQSAVFNDVLDGRLRRGAFDTLLPGDLAQKHDNGALFTVDQAAAELENAPAGRVRRLEISPTGPMWGTDMPRPAGEPLHWEIQALARMGLSPDSLAPPQDMRLAGARRSLRAVVRHPAVAGGGDEHGPYLEVSFDLPAGAFATIVLREIIKPVQPLPEED